MPSIQWSRSSATAKDHIKPWIAYYVFALVFNEIGPYPVNLLGYSAYFLLVIGCFYLLVWLLYKYKAPTETLRLASIVIFIFFVASAAACGLIYGLLPRADIYLYNPDVPFHFGALVQNACRNYLPLLVAAIAYHQSRMKAIKNGQLLAAQRKHAETVEEQLRLERAQRKILEENLSMQSSLITNQRGSHWLHSIFNHVKASLVHNDYASRIVSAYISSLRYLYEHGGSKTVMVLLDVEIDFIRKMLFLNKVAIPDATDVVLTVGRHLVAREIPQLLFATLVENALRYADQHDPDQPIRMEIYSDPECLRFNCWNKKKDPSLRPVESSSVGLANIQRQLDLNFPDRHALDIDDKPTYFDIEVRIYYR
ncbi:sensor histidine kinase [Parapedobacter sp. 2B3]|uniref:sensor histidine kinase n=1 Tax=Parapedobacter sp. 2B3 TaxID=3342381 RepID=UPI0035B649C4